MNRISKTDIYYIYTKDKPSYKDTAIGINELSIKLGRTTQSVKQSIERLGKKEFVLKDKDGIKYEIVCGEELRVENGNKK